VLLWGEGFKAHWVTMKLHEYRILHGGPANFEPIFGWRNAFRPITMPVLRRAAGFEIENRFGDFDSSPFSSKSPKQILISKSDCK
jgi:hypothetical protein